MNERIVEMKMNRMAMEMLLSYLLNNTGYDRWCAYKKFREKLEADVRSNLALSDFHGLVLGEGIRVGKYNIPRHLVDTVMKINRDHGDVSANVRMNPMVAEMAYVVFCAAIKEMDDLPISEITENKMLKWRDAINDALRLNFNVRFAKRRLKKISEAYFDQSRSTNRIFQALSDELSSLKEATKAYSDQLQNLSLLV